MLVVDLIHNLTLLVAISVVSGFISKKTTNETTLAVLQGLLFSAAAVLGMLRPLVISDGLIFDGRSVMISLCALFFGPISALITVMATICMRIYQGGIGTWMGISVILASAQVGLIFHYSQHIKSHDYSGLRLWWFGIIVHIIMVLLMLTLPPAAAIFSIQHVALPVIITYPLATVLVGQILSDQLSRYDLLKSISSSREEYRTTLYSIGDAVITTDNLGNVRHMNKVAEGLTGFTLENAIGRPLHEVFHIISEEDRHVMEDPVHKVLKSKDVVTLSNHTLLISKDGNEYAIADSGAPIFTDSGDITGVVLVFHDQTKERQAEIELRQSEQKFRALFENMAAASSLNEVIYDNGHAVDYRILDVNPAFERATGLARNLIIGKLASQIYAHDPIPFFDSFVKVAETGIPTYIEGFFTPLKIHLQLTVGCPQIGHFSTVFLDITERKQAETRLQRIEWMLTKKPYSSHADSKDIIYTAAPDQPSLVLESVDKRTLMPIVGDFLDMLGTSASIHEQDGRCVLSTYRSEWCIVLSGARRAHGNPVLCVSDCSACTRNGSLESISSSDYSEHSCHCGFQTYSAPIIVNGSPIAAISFVYGEPPHNIDTLKHLAEQHDVNLEDLHMAASAYDVRPPFIIDIAKQRLHSSAQLIGSIIEAKVAESKREQAETQLRQAQKMDAIGRLAGGVAHDFNNMLSVILGYADIVASRLSPDDPIYADIKEIEAAGKRSADLTKHLLAFSRSQTIAPIIQDINCTVNDMLKMLRRLIGENIELVWSPCEQPLWVNMDTTQIDQILANLVVNARDAIAGAGKVSISTHICNIQEPESQYCTEFRAGEYVMVQVSDNGCGMDDNTLTKAFEPFFTTKPLGQGTGLGLATVYGIVQQNNGMIAVSSEVGVGTTVKIYLPKHSEANQLSAEQTQNIPELKEHKTVLVVEDETAVLNLTSSILQHKGYTVYSASLPSQAIEIAKQLSESIDLLVTDVVMPDMNGIELHKCIKQVHPAIKTLFISGYTANYLEGIDTHTETSRFLQKPFTSHDLAITVHDLLSQQQT